MDAPEASQMIQQQMHVIHLKLLGSMLPPLLQNDASGLKRFPPTGGGDRHHKGDDSCLASEYY